MERRKINFTDEERTILMDLMDRHRDVLECKKTDAVSIHAKKKTWEKLADEFNCNHNVRPRTSKQLKKCWDNLKEKWRRAKAEDTRELFKTGELYIIPHVPKLLQLASRVHEMHGKTRESIAAADFERRQQLVRVHTEQWRGRSKFHTRNNDALNLVDCNMKANKGIGSACARLFSATHLHDWQTCSCLGFLKAVKGRIAVTGTLRYWFAKHANGVIGRPPSCSFACRLVVCRNEKPGASKTCLQQFISMCTVPCVYISFVLG